MQDIFNALQQRYIFPHVSEDLPLVYGKIRLQKALVYTTVFNPGSQTDTVLDIVLFVCSEDGFE